MRQFTPIISDSLYEEEEVGVAHLEAETNAELLQILLGKVEYES